MSGVDVQDIKVVKRNGRKESIDLEKIHKVLDWACEGISGVSVSDIEMKAKILFYDGITSEEIHQTLVNACSDLISETTPNYSKVAARLINFDLRKKVYGNFEPEPYQDFVQKMVDAGLYTDELISNYSREEFVKLGDSIRHDRDYDFHYAGMMQMLDKYLVQNRSTGKHYETPQMLYMSIAVTLFMNSAKDERISKVVAYYDAISTFKISIPSPILAGVRTPTKQFSSCVLIEADDSLESLGETAKASINYISKKAGLGISANIRSLGSPVRGGEIYHTGSIPFYKLFQSAIKSCSQGGIRGGAGTVHWLGIHKDVRELLVLKNNSGTEDNRVRHIDYSIQLHNIHYERLIKNENITFVSPHHEGLYESYFDTDESKFREIYSRLESDPSIPKTVMSAREFFSLLMTERKGTGRIYITNVSNMNAHTPFKQRNVTGEKSFKNQVRMSNLCQEVNLSTHPLGRKGTEPFNKSLSDPEGIKELNNYDVDEGGLVALCTLAALNLGKIKLENLDEIESLCEMTVESLDNLLSYQHYPIISAAKHTEIFRPLGIGVTNFAYWLAKNNLKYSDGSANRKVHELFEVISFYLLKASVKLAKDRGCCVGFADTHYYDGKIPAVDMVNKNLSKIVDVDDLKCDWEGLRKDILEYGIRNATVSALMPSESSSQLSNATNGIEPIRSLVTVKGSKSGTLKQVVPEVHKLKNRYEKLWDQLSPQGYLDLVAIMQRFVDQSISANTSYNPNLYPDGKIPMSEMIRHLVKFAAFGGKTLYYFNTNDSVSLTDSEEDDCDSCKI